MDPIISTPDIYECAFYKANKAEVVAVECRIIKGKIACTLQFSGEDLPTLQYLYFHRTAEVNLFKFKKAYYQITVIMANAKRRFKQQQIIEAQMLKEMEEREEAQL